MNNINNLSKELYKSLNGNINTPNLVKYLETIGYSVIFFNTEGGEELLRAYNINPGTTKAFTYHGSTRIVFVDANMHSSDKLYSLLHECGHILLGHIGNNSIDLLNKRSTENEAEVFAYTVLNYHKKIEFRKSLTTIGIILLVLGSSIILHYNASNRYSYRSTETTNVVQTETVYVAPSGAKYHKPDCPSIRNSKIKQLSRSKAEKNYDACRICNP